MLHCVVSYKFTNVSKVLAASCHQSNNGLIMQLPRRQSPSYLLPWEPEITPTKMQFWKQVSGCTELIEDVVIPLFRCLKHHPGFLQKVGPHTGTLDMKLLVEVNFNEFPKS
jgi:hypothetical protein